MGLSKHDLKAIAGVIHSTVPAMIADATRPLGQAIKRIELSIQSIEKTQAEFKMTQDKLVTRVATLEISAGETNRRLGAIENRLDNIDGRIEAAESDIKDIYYMIFDLQSQPAA